MTVDLSAAGAGSGSLGRLVIKGLGDAPVASFDANGFLNATAGGLSTFVKAGAVSDSDFPAPAVDGTMALDSTDGRLYFRSGGGWHYVAQSAGFQIPSTEAFSFDFAAQSFNTGLPLQDGDFLIPFVEKHMGDGAP